MPEIPKPEVGQVVTYVDQMGKKFPALVTAVWSGEYGTYNPPGINLVYVSGLETERDTYGRQIKREASVVHKTNQPAGANCWE